MVRLTRAEQQRRTREVLLRAGLAVFLRRGYLATTVEEIAAEGGYTRGAVYKHFGGKEGLWRAVVDSSADAQLARLRERLAAATSREELIAALPPRAGNVEAEATRWTLLSTEFLAAAAQSTTAAAIVADQREREAEIVTLLGHHAARLGLRPTIPLEHLVVLMPAVTGSLVLRRAADPKVDVDAITTAVLHAAFPEDER